MDYPDHLARLAVDHPALAAELADLRALRGVLDWMARRGLPLDVIDVVAQDEYSHDFLLPLGGAGEYLVFGMT